MSNIRLYEIAKELKKTNKELIEASAQLGIEVKSHLSSISPQDEKKLRNFFIPSDVKKKETVIEKPPERVALKPAEKTAPKPAEIPKIKTPEPSIIRAPIKTTVEKTIEKPLLIKPATAVKTATTPEVDSKKDGKKRVFLKEEAAKTFKKKDSKEKSAAWSLYEEARSRMKSKGRFKYRQKKQNVEKEDIRPEIITIPSTISVSELAELIKISPNTIIMKLMHKGEMVSINQYISFESASEIATEYNITVEKIEQEQKKLTITNTSEKNMVNRPPVVTVLGHVDHGKTSLLDSIRETKVTDSEAGGITQKIGAYSVIYQERIITFIDTPGHEAFTAMRSRGARVTDIAVLVVAADDGIMPQTVEAINHAKAAGVPIIVCINKIDKHNANVEKVKQQLVEHDLLPEDWGGETICVPVSAKEKTGINELLDMILLMADMLELKADPTGKAQGTIIEAKMDKQLGPIATVLVQNGTLRVGQSVVVGLTCGKIRFMLNDKADRIHKAKPSTPVEIIGLENVPISGDILEIAKDDKSARVISVERTERLKNEKFGSLKTNLENIAIKDRDEVKDLNLIIRADVQGSVEALIHSLERLSNDNVRISIVHSGVGNISESDILLASASCAIIIGFNIRPETNIRKLAEQEGVDIRLYRVIYHVLEDITKAIDGLIKPKLEEVMIGRAKVRAIFKIPKIGQIGGCYVIEGKILRSADVRVLRDGVVIYEGKLNSLKRFKDDAKEVQTNFECGIGIENFSGLQTDDIIEAYQLKEVKKLTPKESGELVV